MAVLGKSLFLALALTLWSSLAHEEHHQREEGPSDKYLVVLPRVLIGGSSEVVCITLYEMAEPMNIELLLTMGELSEEYSYFMEFPYACLDLLIPGIPSPSMVANLSITARSSLVPSIPPIFMDSKSVMIERSKQMTFVETDKPIYKPGQSVKFRILTVDDNLRPDNSEVDKIWVETPSGVRIAQWLSVEVNHGLISLELPMTSDPMLGTWKIFVEHHGERLHTKFDVEEYVLPKFEVDVEGPSYLVVNETSVEYTVCGRYTYGQPVAGRVRATLSPTFSFSRREVHPVTFEAESTGSDGCVAAVFDISEWDLTSNFYSIFDSKLTFAVDFTEIVTGPVHVAYKKVNSAISIKGDNGIEVDNGIKEDTIKVTITEEDDSCIITYNMFKLDFVGNKDYKEGLPFSGKVLLTTPDGSIVAGRNVNIEMVSGGQFSVDVVTDTSGQASFDLPSIGGTTVVLTASIPGVSTLRERGMFTVTAQTARLALKSHFSPSDTFLQISDHSDTISVGDEVQLKVAHTSTQDLSSRDFRPVFSSKGNIIRPQYRLSGSESTGSGYKVLDLVFIATSDMAPSTNVVIYFVQDGEVVADSTNIRVQQSFANEVQVSFSSSEGKPGDETELLVSASSASLCGVGIVDKSVYLLGGGSNNIQEKQVSQFLQEFELNENSGVESDRCSQRRSEFDDWSWRMYRPTPEATDASTAFTKAGLLYLTNLELETSPCPIVRGRFHMEVAMMMPMAFDSRQRMSPENEPEMLPDIADVRHEREPPRLRAYFPETWLWDLVPVTDQTSVTLTVPDTITEWIGNGFCISETDGIGISSTSNLQAFQPFFVSYTLPYSVIRGETFPVKVTVFNYMTDCLLIELVLSESENFTLAANEDRTKEMCVCGSQSASVEFNIIPTMIGSMPVEVTAMSVSDFMGICDNSVMLTDANAGDAIRQEIIVEAEGIENEITKSDFFCPSNSSSGFTWTIDIDPPADAVPDTVWAKVTLTGDVMGTTLSNLQNLLRVPYGCGEQNMLTFVPNVLAMQYLKVTDQLTPDVAQEAVKNMKLGYQREFNYRHGDGSFSAFGENDEEGSSWLTAYVIRSFYQASPFIEVDFDDLSRSVSWLKSLQQFNGCFMSVGKLCHKDMLGGINNDLTLSAYIIISLLEAGEDPTDDVIVHGVECLESQLASTEDTYALSQIAYALALANRATVNDVMGTLELVALYGDGGKHWASNRGTSIGSAVHHSSSPSTDVEMTSYVLMAYMELLSPSEVVIEGLPVSKWLVQRRNARGGFSSTQDTVVGLTALSRFAKYTVGGDLDISLTVGSSETQDWGDSKELVATNENRLVLQQVYLDRPRTTLEFVGSGEGCALLQVSSFFNTYPEEPELPEFGLLVTVEDLFSCTEFYVRVCASYTGDDEASNMAVVDFRLQSGYVAVKDTLEVLKDNEPTLKRYELDGKSVLFYFDEIRLIPTCIGFTMMQDIKVKDTKPSFVTVYDYYKTDVKKIVTYSLECSVESDILLEPQARKWGTLDGIELALPGPIFVDVCQPKDGTCQTVDENAECEEISHLDECLNDVQCPGERKCCSDGCGNVCTYPQFLNGQPGLTSPECRLHSCPVCESELPKDWFNKFCISDLALSVKIKQRQRAKLYTNHMEDTEMETIIISYSLDEGCDCEIQPDEKYMILANEESLDMEERRLHLSETSLIFPYKRKYLKQFVKVACPTN